VICHKPTVTAAIIDPQLQFEAARSCEQHCKQSLQGVCCAVPASAAVAVGAGAVPCCCAAASTAGGLPQPHLQDDVAKHKHVQHGTCTAATTAAASKSDGLFKWPSRIHAHSDNHHLLLLLLLPGYAAAYSGASCSNSAP
jgi:hypothetical protein